MTENTWYGAGTVGRDAEDKTFPSGSRVVSFSIAINTKAKGTIPEKTTWVPIKAFGYNADNASSIKKGMNVFVKGPLCIDSYEGKDGTKKQSTYVIANVLGVLERQARTEKAEFVPKQTEKITFNQEELDDIPF